ncbi:MAG: chemotaxis protein CheX [Syntrophomonadaceae bacterium]|jgi:chemotaxis protein CheX
MNNSSYMAPFIKAAIKICKEMLGLTVNSANTENEGDSFESRGFIVIVGFTGGWRGRFFLDMSQATAMKLAEAVTGDSYQEVNEEVMLCGAEIGNIISGNAITDVNNTHPGINVRLTPPSIFAGQSLSLFNVNLSSWSVLMQTGIGEMKINVAVEEGKK